MCTIMSMQAVYSTTAGIVISGSLSWSKDLHIPLMLLNNM